MTQVDREHPRYAHEAMITLRAPELVVSGRTSNLSRGGLSATLSEQIAVGIVVDVDIQLVFSDEAQSEPLSIPARIVWCTSLDEGHQVGASFLPLDAERSEYLTMFLRYLNDEGGDEAPEPPSSIDDRFG